MAQCPYTASLLVTHPDDTPRHPRQLRRVRCERRAFGRGWHLHDAPVPEDVATCHHGIRIRWRSSSAADNRYDDHNIGAKP